MKSKSCSACKAEKPISHFSKSASYRDGHRGQCKSCRVLYQIRYEAQPDRRAIRRNRIVPDHEKQRKNEWWFKKAYGISRSDAAAILGSQGGVCAVCRTKKPGGRRGMFVVDHCHATGAVRGMLCSRCNVGLGMIGDTYEAAQRAVEYLGNQRIAPPIAAKAG